MNEIIIALGSRVSSRVEGITVWKISPSTGKAEKISSISDIELPTFQTYDSEHQRLYSVSETEVDGTVVAYQLDSDYSATLLQTIPSMGGSPCHVALGKGELAMANYGTGVFSIYKTEPILGPLYTEIFEGMGKHPIRQERSHIHSSLYHASTSTWYVADLGLDSIVVYDDTFNQVRSIASPPGTGPRHMAFGGSFLYVVAELSSEVLVYNESFELVQRITTLPFHCRAENTAADIHITNDGAFLYCSNRGHDSIACFSIERESGLLSCIGHHPTEKEPRNFALVGNDTYLVVANGSSDSVCVFERGASGCFGSEYLVRITLPQPVCITVLSE